MLRGFEGYADSVDEAGLLELVPTEAWNIKLTTPDDLRLAEAIEHGLRSLSLPAGSRDTGWLHRQNRRAGQTVVTSRCAEC